MAQKYSVNRQSSLNHFVPTSVCKNTSEKVDAQLTADGIEQFSWTRPVASSTYDKVFGLVLWIQPMFWKCTNFIWYFNKKNYNGSLFYVLFSMIDVITTNLAFLVRSVFKKMKYVKFKYRINNKHFYNQLY